MDLKKIKERRQKMQLELLNEAKKYAKKVHAKLPDSKILVYGSVVRGDFNSSSDIDILVISDMMPENFNERTELLINETFRRIEPKGYTQKEFRLIKNKPNFREMLKNKIVII